MHNFTQNSSIFVSDTRNMRKFSNIMPSILLLTALLSCACDRYVELRGYAQGSTYCVKLNLKGSKLSQRSLSEGIDNLLTELDTTFSGYNHSSVLSRLNKGEKIVPSPMFTELLEVSDSFRLVSEGAFDHYGAPLFDIWGFGFKNDSLPDNSRVEEALVRCREKKTLNFNAIAQGYSCDVIARFLEKAGIEDYLVDIGEIRCKGYNPNGRGWSIGIDTPSDGNDTPGAKLSGVWYSDGACHGVVTSGNYRKFYIKDGKKYAHTIDPRSGYPVHHNLLSATVIAPDATEADAVATWLMVIGFEEAKAKILGDSRLEACLITADSTWTSPGF